MSKSPEAFRTISEVAEWLDVPAHVLRFWESRFAQVKPVKRAGGRRYYRPTDMELLGGIKRLLHGDGMTIRGVQKILREDGVRHVASLSGPLNDGPEIRLVPGGARDGERRRASNLRDAPSGDAPTGSNDAPTLAADEHGGTHPPAVETPPGASRGDDGTDHIADPQDGGAAEDMPPAGPEISADEPGGPALAPEGEPEAEDGSDGDRAEEDPPRAAPVAAEADPLGRGPVDTPDLGPETENGASPPAGTAAPTGDGPAGEAPGPDVPLETSGDAGQPGTAGPVAVIAPLLARRRSGTRPPSFDAALDRARALARTMDARD